MTWSFLDVAPPFGIAHRGGTGVAPENTMAAFEAAVALGYRYLETDVHRTADGELVAFHDEDLRRVAGRPMLISQLTWNDIKEIELPGGHQIPRLVDLLDAFPDARFNIDPKADESVEPLIEIIQQDHVLPRVAIGSFSEDRIQRIQRAVGPDLCTSPGPRGVMRVLGAAAWGRGDLPYGCLQIPWQVRGIRTGHPKLIARVQALGLQVHFWTVNDRTEMVRLLDAGADAIITDEVAMLAEILADRN